MRATQLTDIAERMYTNNGQHLEQIFRYNMSKEICKADNRPGTDYEDIQIKSARATICKGADIESHIKNDVARRYVYITKSLVAYEMSKKEYLEFAIKFATLTRESTKNGGQEKMRLKTESKEMLEWLRVRT